MSFAVNVSACHACPDRAVACQGPCPCGVDGRDIVDHARAGDCPRGRFPPPGAGPVRLSTSVGPSHRVPAGFDPADWRLDSGGSGGCGCK